MDDYSINAKITVDTSGFESGIKKAQKASKNLSKSVSKVIQGLGKSGLVGALGAVGLASQGVSATLGAVSKITKKVTQTINECTEAYKKQYKAELALETVAKNNPYMNSSSVRNLKNYASEIQKISDYGDEELLPLMANLTALGRTEEETMQIMKVAVDMASTGMYTLDTAVQQLNATMNGNIGRLGQQNAELKDLTEEELKSGKAVEILGKKYEGLAKTTADSSIQLNNAIGDFKELIGETFEKSLTPMRKYFTEIITRTNNAISKAREHKRAVADVFTDDGNVKTATAQTDNLQQSLIDLQKEYERIYKDQQNYLKLYGKYVDQATDETTLGYKRELDAIQEKIKKITDELLARKKASEFATTEAEKEKSRLENEQKIAKLKQDHLEKISAQEAKWNNIEKITGEAVSNEEKLKFYQDDLVAIMTEANGQISTENQYYKDQMVIIDGLIKKIAENPTVSTEWVDKLKKQRIEMLEDERARAIKNAKSEGKETYSIWRDYNEKILELKIESIEKEKEEALNAEDVTAEDKIAINEYYANKIKEIYQDLGDFTGELNEEEEEEEESKFDKMLAVAKDYAKKITSVFSKVAQTIGKSFSAVANFIKSAFSGITNIFKKLFEFDTDTALNALLKVEDMILTFFVETLPKLPSFFESAFSSVLVLINTLVSAIDWEKVKDVVSSMVETFVKYAPDIVSGIVDLFTGLFDTISSVLVDKAPEIVEAFKEMFFAVLEALPSIFSNVIEVVGTFVVELGKAIIDNADRLTEDLNAVVESIVTGISDFIEGGGWKTILDAILTIQNVIQTVITDNLEEIVNTIIDMLPDFIDFFIESFVSASQAISKVIKPIIKLVMALLDAVFEILLSDEVMDAGLTVGEALIEGIIGELIPKLIVLIVKNIPKIIGSILKMIPKMILAIVKGLVKGFVNTNWIQVVKDMFTGFIDGVKDFFGIHSPSTLFAEFGGFMVEGLWNGISNLGQWLWDNVVGFFSNLWEGITNVFANVGDWFSETFSSAKDGMTTVFENVGDWFSNVFSSAKDGVSSAFEGIGDWASNAWDSIKKGFSNVGSWFSSTFSTAWTNAKAGFSKVGDWASGVWKNVKDGFSGVGNWFKSTFSTAWTNIKSAWSGVGDWFKGVADKIKTNFSNCVDNMKSAFSKAGSWVKDMAGKIGSGLSKAGEAIKDGASWVGNKIKDFFGFANGTNNAPRGLALVGEAGPELVRFNGGEQVLNNRNTQKALADMGKGSNVFNVTFNNTQDTTAFAMMSQLKRYQRNLAFNGVL